MTTFEAARTDILNAIGQMETATKTVSPDRKAQIADAFQRRRITDDELRAAIVWVVEVYDGAFMPATARLLAAARSPAASPTADPATESRDPIIGLENEITVQSAWLRELERRNDTQRAGWARVEIERAQTRINNRLHERGLSARYVGVGVEVFGSDERSGAGRPVPLQASLSHWGDEPDRED